MSYRTYYRGPDAVVTDVVIVWRNSTPTKGFAVRDLQNVGIACSEVSRLSPYTAPVVGGTLIMAGASWLILDRPVAYVVCLLLLAVSATFATTFTRRRPRRWELRATYRGHKVILYASHDLRVFNQVTRGLRRAMESARSPAPGYGLAS